MSKMSNQKEGENTLIKIEINNKNYSMNRFDLLEFLSLYLVSDKTLNSSSEYLRTFYLLKFVGGLIV